jgi:C4-dicarboxylate-specific signal transduction histidine kinase
MFSKLVGTNCRQDHTLECNGRWLCVRLAPLHDESGKLIGAVHTMADVTERKQLEQTARAAERELEKQRVLRIDGDRLRSLGEMAAGIAHELNQPLVGVRGLAEHLLLAMQRGWDLPEDKVRQKLSLVIQQADRMSQIIDHVRVFAREADKPECCSVKWNEVIEAALQMIGAQLRSRGLAVQTELAEDLPLVSANPFSLEEILLNLVFNARDAVLQRSSAGHPLRPPDIRLRSKRPS